MHECMIHFIHAFLSLLSLSLSIRLVLLAGDVSPMDVLSHVPLLCEESAIPYIFVPSKVALGLASSTKRPTSCLMLCPKPTSDYTKYYEEVLQETKAALLVAV